MFGHHSGKDRTFRALARISRLVPPERYEDVYAEIWHMAETTPLSLEQAAELMADKILRVTTIASDSRTTLTVNLPGFDKTDTEKRPSFKDGLRRQWWER